MKEISRTVFVKNGSKWEETYKTLDNYEVYRDLAQSLIAKKMHKCTYITSIQDRSNYDGTRTITVYYDNGVKNVYVVENR